MIVNFVRPLNHEPSELMVKTFEDCSSADGSCQWITEDDCLEIKERNSSCTYIFNEFKGKAFENIEKTGNRIFSPICIAYFFNIGTHLPKKPHPVFNTALEGCVISCTSLERAERERLHTMITWMCGKVSKDFNEVVTHLVAGEVGSKKYMVAASMKKKIMSPEWIDRLFEVSQIRFAKGDDLEFQGYACPVFKGLVVTVSGLEISERAEVKEMVEKEGGRYTGEMKINECTHLVLHKAKGQKYEFAKKWKIPIVSPKWLYESIDLGYCQDEQKYKVSQSEEFAEPKQTTSTPTKNSTGVSRLSSIADVSAISVSAVNETAANQSRMTTLLEDPPTVHPLDSLKLVGIKAQMFLDGCKVYISGFNDAHLKKIRKIIDLGGGTRFSQINESTSHVIIGDKLLPEIEQLKQSEFRPLVVNYGWLLECLSKKDKVDETPYVALQLGHIEPTTPIKGSLQDDETIVENAARSRMAPPKACDNESTNLGDMQDLMSQYLPGNFTGESALVRAAEVTVDPNEEENDDTTMEGEATEVGDATDDGGGIFKNKTFVILGFDNSDEEVLSDMIENAGGSLVGQKSRAVPDYAVVTVFGSAVEMTVGDIVTNAWMQMCIEADELLPIESNAIFTPLNIWEDEKPLEGCVLSMSGFHGVERDTLMHIAQELGAHCNECFVRKPKPKDNLKGNTHLILLKAEGSKYDAAKRWNIPALTKFWVIEAAKSGRKPSEDRFLIENYEADEECSGNTTPRQTPVRVNDPARQTPSSVKAPLSEPAAPRTPRQTPVRVNDPARQTPSSVKAPLSEPAAVNVQTPSEPPVQQNTDSPHGSISKDMDIKTPLRDVSEQNIDTQNDQLLTIEGMEVSTPLKDVTDQNIDIQQQNEVTMKSATRGVRTPQKTETLPSNTPVTVTNILYAEENAMTSSTDETKPLLGCVISFGSGILGVEYESLVQLAEELGAFCQLLLMKRPRGELKACTHLILDKPEGYKYKSAKRWDIPAVSKFWLFEAAKFKKKPDEAKYLIDNPKSVMSTADSLANYAAWHKDGIPPESLTCKAPTAQLKPQRIAELMDTEKESPRQGQSPVGIDTPSKFLNPDGVYIPKFDFSETLAELATPEGRKIRKRRMSTPLDVLLGRCLAISIKNSEVTPSKNDAVGMVKDVETPKVDTQNITGPLEGVVIAVARKLCSKQSEYNDIATSLGASYTWTYDSSCTHYIFQGRNNDPNKEFRKAREEKKIIVSPHWLYACQDQACWVDEKLYPHTFNPNLSLSMSSQTPARSVRRTRNTRLTAAQVALTASPVVTKSDPAPDNTSDEKSLSTNLNPSSISETALINACNDAEMEIDEDKQSSGLVNNLMSLMAATKSNKSRRKSRRFDSPENSSDDKSRPTSRQSRTSRPDTSASRECSGRGSAPRFNQYNLDTQTDSSQMVEVSWDDHSARVQQEMLAPELAKMSENESVGSGPEANNYSTEDEDAENIIKRRVSKDEDLAEDILEPDDPSFGTAAASRLSPETVQAETSPPVFFVSGLTPDEKKDYGALVESLNGIFCDSAFLDERCTHVVINTLSRNEKYFAATASGKWILHKSYFEACRQEGKFVSEEDHEWGGPGTRGILESAGKSLQTLASAAYRRRRIKDENGDYGGAFQGWRVLLITDSKREVSFQRLLEYGGATVSNGRRDSKALETYDYTHAFMELSKAKVEVDITPFVQAGVPCLKPEYISAYLVEENEPAHKLHYIPEASALIRGTGRLRKRKTQEPATPNKRSKRS